MLETAKTHGYLALLVPAVLLTGFLVDPGTALGEAPNVHRSADAEWLSCDGAEEMDSLHAAHAEFIPSDAGNFTNGTCSGGPSCKRCSRNGWYLSASGGWQHRETVHEAANPQTFINFEDGFAANAALGYRFERFRIEAETSFMNNEVERAGAEGLSSSAAGNVNLRALMFNLYHDMEIDIFSWNPYVGAGIGLYQSEINSLYPQFFDVAGAPMAHTPVNTTSDIPFAYQFRLGLTRTLSQKTEFYSGYRYFRGEELEFASRPFAEFDPTFHPEGSKNHSVEFGFRVNF